MSNHFILYLITRIDAFKDVSLLMCWVSALFIVAYWWLVPLLESEFSFTKEKYSLRIPKIVLYKENNL